MTTIEYLLVRNLIANHDLPKIMVSRIVRAISVSFFLIIFGYLISIAPVKEKGAIYGTAEFVLAFIAFLAQMRVATLESTQDKMLEEAKIAFEKKQTIEELLKTDGLLFKELLAIKKVRRGSVSTPIG